MHINEPRIIRRISDDDKTTRVSDKRPFCFKMPEELIWGILRENNVELSKDTLNFYLKKVLEDHKDLYNSMSVRIGRNKCASKFSFNIARVRTFKFLQNYGLLDYGV